MSKSSYFPFTNADKGETWIESYSDMIQTASDSVPYWLFTVTVSSVQLRMVNVNELQKESKK